MGGEKDMGGGRRDGKTRKKLRKFSQKFRGGNH